MSMAFGGTMRRPSMVFFGSGPVAARSLELAHKDFGIEAVVTKPRPAHHRGGFPVLDLAKKLGIKTLTVASKQELDELFAGKPFSSRLGLVVDFGIIISKDVIDYFPFGIINSHFSLLPEWRGADPITFAILSGQPETGVSLMLINEKLDEGQLLARQTYTVSKGQNAVRLTTNLINISHQLLKKFLPEYLAGKLQAYAQDPTIKPSYSRKLTKADGEIDWDKPAEQIEREIRAYIEWPKSRAKIGSIDVIIKKAAVVKESGKPGSFRQSKKELVIFCKKDALKILDIQPPNKNPMPIESFLAGYKLGLG